MQEQAHSDARFLRPGGKALQTSERWKIQNKRKDFRNFIWLETGNRVHGHTKKDTTLS